MEADSFYNMGNENFTLDGYKCSVRSYPLDEEEEGIAVTPKLDEPLRYAFSGMNGLCITTQYGSVLETDLLGKFLSALSNADEMEHPNHYDFVKEYGFFFPIREDDRFVISRHSFQNICNRLKYTVLLYNMISQGKYDYVRMLNCVTYLIASGRQSVSLGDRAS